MSLGRGIILGTVVVLLVLAVAGVVALDFYLRQTSAVPQILRPTQVPAVIADSLPILEPPPTPTFIVVPISLPPTSVTPPPTPTRAETIEGEKEAETYVVQAGDTLSGIASRFEVTVEEIIAENGIADPSLIQVGQELVIPAG